MNKILLVLFLHIATPSEEGKITCTIPPVQMSQDAVLTCNFPEDLNVTKKDFAIYHYLDDNRDDLVDCWWRKGNMTCSAKPDIVYQTSVNRTFTILLLNVSSTHTGQYACQVANYDPQLIKTCHFQINFDAIEDHRNPLVIVVSTVLVVAVFVAILVIVVMLKRRSCALQRRETQASEDNAHLPMIDKETNEDVTTRKFQEYLNKSIKTMYPDALDSFYFVPPIYFNKIRYETQIIAGQVVYVPQPPDLNDVRHDRAMQHVLHCLRHMAEVYEEPMFVLTQFKFEDYLNNPGNTFANHRLPVPVKGCKGETEVGCCDVLIIHRHLGLVVGVVKSLSHKDDGSEDSERRIDKLLVSKVCEAVAQVKYAKTMMEHLMSDHKQKPSVHMALIVPNVTLSSLQRALGSHSQVVQSLRECLHVKVTEDPTHLCLCANYLSNPCNPWDIDSCVMSHLRKWWNRFMNQSEGYPKMSDELYQNMIARFCGPATQSTLQVMDEILLQPKTLADAVCLTGNLYERLTLYPDMIQLLSEQRLFLVGPPNTGKTRMLTLAGKHWVESGHELYILVSKFAHRDLMSSFSKSSQYTPVTNDTSRPLVTQVNCNFKHKKELNEIFAMLTTHGKKNITLCVIANEVDYGRKHFQTSLESLRRQHPNLLLWATSSTSKDVPDGWKVKTFTRALSCPPAVVREASRAGAGYVLPGADIKPRDCLTPTDGPPVKYIYHEMDSTGLHYCTQCGKMVAEFLNKHLFTKSNKRAYPDDTTKTTSTITRVQNESPTLKGSSILQDKDILVIFENDKHEVLFLQELKKVGFQVKSLEAENEKGVMREEKDCVCSMHVDRFRKFRRRCKVVVYVESKTPPEGVSKKWRGITSCTAQLIIVRWKTT